MEKVYLCVAITFLLGGCASSSNLREQAPTLQLTSSNTAKDVALCLSEKWEKLLGYNTHLSVLPRRNGSSLEIRGEFGTVGTIIVADISDSVGGGSETSVYTYPYIFQPVPKKLPEAAVSCQGG